MSGDAHPDSDSFTLFLAAVARAPTMSPVAACEYERAITGRVLLEDRYELGGELARGAMGRVFRARDRLLARDVAVKLIRLDGVDVADHAVLLSNFEREALATARLNHPNIVTIHTFGAWRGLPYLVLELADGHGLAELVAQGPLPPARAVHILEQVLRGLAHAHDLGVLHRDLKPQNVFVRRDGVVKILDFGLSSQRWRATRTGTSETDSHTTLPGAGTPAYMAPEQWRGDRQDERTDLWAVGITAYEMLTGTLPPNGNPELATLRGMPGLAAIVNRAIAREPAGRFRDAGDMLAALAPFCGDRSAAPQRRWRMTAPRVAIAIVAAAGAYIARTGLASTDAHPLTFQRLLTGGASPWRPSTIPICWDTDGFAQEKAWIRDALAGEESWTAHADIDLVGWEPCRAGSVGVRIALGTTMTSDAAGEPSQRATRVELDVSAAPEATWTRCRAHQLSRQECIQIETLHLIGGVLGVTDDGTRSAPIVSCRWPELEGFPGANGVDGSLVTRCGTALHLHALDVAAAEALYGARPDDEVGNAAVARDRRRVPYAVATVVDPGGHVRVGAGDARPWRWWDAGGPVGWKGRFATSVELAADGATRIRSFGIAIDGRLHEYTGVGAVWGWRDRGRPVALVGSPSTITYVEDDGAPHTRVFALGGDGRLYDHDERDGTWRDHGGPGGLVGSPTAISYIEETGRRWIRIFVIDAAGDLHERTWDGNAWTWVDHRSPVALAGSVSIAAYLYQGSRRINVFAIGRGGHLYELWWHRRDSGWGWSWSDKGGPGDLVGSPSSVTYVDRNQLRRLHVFAVGAGGHLHEFSWNGGDWAWADKGSPGPELTGSPAAVAYHDAEGQLHLDVVAVDRRGQLRDRSLAGAGWRWVEPGGGALAPIRR